MTYRRNILAGAAIILACGLPAGLFGADPVPANVTAAINSFARDITEKVRDPQMKPAAVLTFAEVKTGGAVVEFVPGDGYWTKLLAKSVGYQGHVYPLVPVRGFLNYRAERVALEKAAAAAGKPKPLDPLAVALSIQFIQDFRNVKAIAESIDFYHGNFGIPEQADVIFNANAYHDFHNTVTEDRKSYPPGGGPFDMTEINRSIYRAMKPGAVYVISDYASAPGAGFSATDTLKRSDPEAVKAELTGVGFEFDGSSDALANPADDHNKPADPANNPDRFILKFRKPRNAPATDRRPTGEVLAKWQKNWIGNSFVEDDWDRISTQYYHADLTLQEEGGNPDSGVLLSSYYWDAQGHNCQYHENPDAQGTVFCHALDTVEAMNAEPGGYKFAFVSGAPNSVPSMRILVKGQARPRARTARDAGLLPQAFPRTPGRGGAAPAQ